MKYSVDEIKSMVIEAWQNTLEMDEEFDMDESIFVYGGNSLHLVKIAEYFSENYDISLEIEDIYNNDTINLLVNYISQIS